MKFKNHIFIIVALYFLTVVIGIGQRDPWPPDEPRFALIGRDMANGQDLLIPKVNNEIYAQKPPLFMWASAACQYVTGSLRIGFLLPSLIGSLVTLLLTIDLARRLWGRRAGMYAGYLLLVTVQYTVVSRGGQIDAFLTMFVTLASYGILRHLLLGPAWNWWYIANVSMGLGIITKGVGFLPLFFLPAWYLAARYHKNRLILLKDSRWAIGHAYLLAAIGIWIIPLFISIRSSGNAEYMDYAKSILLGQTYGRYLDPSHHFQWFGYYLVNVLPSMWLPISGALLWIAPAVIRRLRRVDPKTMTIVGGLLGMLLFFSFTAGKRGIYMFPLLPVYVVFLSRYMDVLVRKKSFVIAQRGFGIVIVAILLILSFLVLFRDAFSVELIDIQTWDVFLVLIIGIMTAILIFWKKPQHMLVCTMSLVWIIYGLLVIPRINIDRSSSGFMQEVAGLLGEDGHLGIVPIKTKEQFLLFADRPVTSFGYQEGSGDIAIEAASQWLHQDENNWLLVSARAWNKREGLSGIYIDTRHSREWILVNISNKK